VESVRLPAILPIQSVPRSWFAWMSFLHGVPGSLVQDSPFSFLCFPECGICELVSDEDVRPLLIYFFLKDFVKVIANITENLISFKSKNQAMGKFF